MLSARRPRFVEVTRNTNKFQHAWSNEIFYSNQKLFVLRAPTVSIWTSPPDVW